MEKRGLPDFHEQRAEPFTLGQPDTGEFNPELLPIDPSDNGLIHTQRPFVIG